MPEVAKKPAGWVRQIVLCNPLYLVSAVLIALGIFLVTRDERFFDTDASQLVFNFSSVQLYALVLVAAVIFLVRRNVPCDALLLIVIESVFVFVPFILLNGAIFISSGLTWTLAALALVAIGCRYAVLRRRCRGLLMPGRLLLFGLPFLALNLTLPLLFRSYLGTDGVAEFGVAVQSYRLVCQLVLPVLLLLPMLLPNQGSWAATPLRQPWIPRLMMLLWSGLSAFHHVWIAFVYDIDVPWSYFLPAAWALVWSMTGQMKYLLRTPRAWLPPVLAAVPVLTTALLYVDTTASVARPLVAINIAIYVVLLLRRWQPLLVSRLLLVSIAGLLPTLPGSWGSEIFAFDNQTALLYFVLTAVVLTAVLVRHPAAGVAGAISSGLLVWRLLAPIDGVGQIAATTGFAFVVIHSLYWRDADQPGAGALRVGILSAWLLHMLCLAVPPGGWWFVVLNSTVAAAVAAPTAWAVLVRQRLELRLALIGVGTVFAGLPLKGFIVMIRAGALGALVILAAFIAFAFGTWIAWRKRTREPAPAAHRPLSANRETHIDEQN